MDKDKITINWTEKYRPKKLSDVIGHPSVIRELEEWADEWQYGTPKNKALTLYGRPGLGKTSAAYALANDMGWEVIELNASDQRTASKIEKIAGNSSRLGSFSGEKRLIIIDEADNIYGREDRGGEKAVIELIKQTNQPIILTANEFYEMSPGLRKAGKPIQFKKISDGSIVTVLRNIANAENIVCFPGVLEKIAEQAEGDLRSAINDFEAIALSKKKIEMNDIIPIERDIKQNAFKVLEKMFQQKNINVYKETITLDQNPEQFINWIDENLPTAYSGKDLVNGYDYLSKASVYLGRVRRRQNYTFWKYASFLMTSGVSIAKLKENKMYVKYQTPTFFQQLGRKKRFRDIRESVAGKISARYHVTKRRVKNQLFPFFKMLMKDRQYALFVAASLDLNTEEIEFMSGYDADTIQKIYDEAQKIITIEKEQDIEMYGKFGEWLKKEKARKEKEEKEKELQKMKEEGHGPEEGDKERKVDKSQRTLFDC